MGENTTEEISPNNRSAVEGNVIDEKFSCVLYQDVKISVYQGHITEETADVIVSPAGKRLWHDGGAAGAIVRVGGRSIQDECFAIIKKRHNKPLEPGDVVKTNAGSLSCKFIIHAVGPKWNEYQHQEDTAKKILFNAVFSCLKLADHNSATSISIPAIGSGLFGVPVPIVAEVLFAAATNFAENASKSNNLKDIRFVDIDKPTSQAFAQEMKKRFGSLVRREKSG